MTDSTTMKLRQLLRRETAASHSRLDEVMGTHPPFASLENYQRYLLGMRSVCQYAAASTNWVEQRIGLPRQGSDLSRWIDEDLATLGLVGQRDQSVAESPPLRMTDEWHWGRAYVIEGSAMGATFLLKQAKIDLPSQVGRSFLTQSATNAKSRWPIFAEALALVATNADDAIAGANDVFGHAYQVFTFETH
jgi:heme oxygenase